MSKRCKHLSWSLIKHKVPTRFVDLSFWSAQYNCHIMLNHGSARFCLLFIKYFGTSRKKSQSGPFHHWEATTITAVVVTYCCLFYYSLETWGRKKKSFTLLFYWAKEKGLSQATKRLRQAYNLKCNSMVCENI